MASSEGGDTAISGLSGPLVVPAGSGLTPDSSQTQTTVALWSDQLDAGAYGTTALSGQGISKGPLWSVKPDTGDYGATELSGAHLRIGSLGLTTYFKMRAVDANAAPSLVYRTWVVTSSPDASASRYSGSHSGDGINFTDVVIEDVWRA